jgi:predicted hydrocarbon binding protein
MDALPVPIEVDPTTGTWSSEGQPMILIPRRFFVFIQMEAERQFGIEATARLYDAATRRGARVWCEVEEKRSGGSGEEVFKRYLERISSRGMGQFSLSALSVEQGVARVTLHNSIFVAEYGRRMDRKVCSSFAAAFAGAMEYLRHTSGLATDGIAAREQTCQSCGDDQCVFEIEKSPVVA